MYVFFRFKYWINFALWMVGFDVDKTIIIYQLIVIISQLTVHI